MLIASIVSQLGLGSECVLFILLTLLEVFLSKVQLPMRDWSRHLPLPVRKILMHLIRGASDREISVLLNIYCSLNPPNQELYKIHVKVHDWNFLSSDMIKISIRFLGTHHLQYLMSKR